MLKPFSLWKTFNHWCVRWNVYSRAYHLRWGIPNPFWFITIYTRGSLFKNNAITAFKYMSRGTILDIGTGSGRQPSLLVEMAPNITAVGVDIQPILIHDAQQRTRQKKNYDRISFLLADVQALPFANQSFDMVTSTMSLHQWPDRRKGVIEIRRVLKDKGIAVILVGNGFVRKAELEAIFEDVGFKDIQIAQKDMVLQIIGQK